MFNEEKWKEFQAKQPIYAVYAREKTLEEVNHLESSPEEEPYFEYERVFEVLYDYGVFTKSGTLLADLKKLLAC